MRRTGSTKRFITTGARVRAFSQLLIVSQWSARTNLWIAQGEKFQRTIARW